MKDALFLAGRQFERIVQSRGQVKMQRNLKKLFKQGGTGKLILGASESHGQT